MQLDGSDNSTMKGCRVLNFSPGDWLRRQASFVQLLCSRVTKALCVYVLLSTTPRHLLSVGRLATGTWSDPMKLVLMSCSKVG